MSTSIKRILYTTICSFLVLISCVLPLCNFTEATPPKFANDFASYLTLGGWLFNPDDFGVSKDKTLRENVVALFYPGGTSDNTNAIYNVIRGLTLGLMIVFIVRAGAGLLFSKDPKTMSKTLNTFIYILIGGAFIYGANRLFGSVFDFNSKEFVAGENGFEGVTDALIGENSVFFFVLSALKAAAFFFAIIMIVLTGIRVIGAGEGEKGKKLVKGLINVVVALLIIKGIDFVYYLAADSNNFVENASNFIINVARIFGYIYGVIIVIMIFIAGYLYITNGGGESNFKKASTILINILLSGIVLFVFLLILYQVFAEFQTGGDAVTVTLLLNPAMSYV